MVGPTGACPKRAMQGVQNGRLLGPALLLLATLAAQAGAQSNATTSSGLPAPELSASSTPLKVCTASWSPMVNCSAEHDPSTFSGHDMDLFRQAADLLDLQEGSDYAFACMRFSSMIADLTAGNGTCDLAIAGITVTTKRQAAGIPFSYPYFHSGLGMLVKTTAEAPDGWAFVKPFQWSLWLALGLTLLILPTMVFVIEFLSLKKRINRRDWMPAYRESTSRALWQVMLFDNIHVSSSGARVAVLTFGFMSLILANTYTASLASFLTVTSLKSQISSVSDLRGRAVASHGIYVQELQDSFGLAVINKSFNSGADQLKLGQDVSAGILTAAIDDLPAMQYVANIAAVPLCDLIVLDEVLLPFDYAIAFRKGTSVARVDAFSGAVLRLQETQALKDLKELYIVGSTTYGGCSASRKATSVREQEAAVGFGNVWGLWVILGGGVVVGGVIMMAQRSCRQRRKQGARRGSRGGMDLERKDSAASGDSGREPFPRSRSSMRFMAAVASKVRRGQRAPPRVKRDSRGEKEMSGEDDLVQSSGETSPKAAAKAPASPSADGRQPAAGLSALQHSHSIFDGATVTWGRDDDV